MEFFKTRICCFEYRDKNKKCNMYGNFQSHSLPEKAVCKSHYYTDYRHKNAANIKNNVWTERNSRKSMHKVNNCKKFPVQRKNQYQKSIEKIQHHKNRIFSLISRADPSVHAVPDKKNQS